MNRRRFVIQSSLAVAGVMLSRYSFAGSKPKDFRIVRIPEGKRKFRSEAVERTIQEVKKNIGNKEIGWLFENCFPNTLDTTVDFEMIDGRPDTYVITGDIDAMWLRDSSAQVWPYLPLCKEDKHLSMMIKGLISRQAGCILKDPYANAFYKDDRKISQWHTDDTDRKPGVHERKWEIDSLCYPIRLAHGYWKATGDISAFDRHWFEAMKNVVKTFKEQQRFEDHGPYHFRRKEHPINRRLMMPYGTPVKADGLICSMFRPSDDETKYLYLIPSNFFAVTSLRQLLEIAAVVRNDLDMEEINKLIGQVSDALKQYGIVNTKQFGDIYAYEVDGLGHHNLMDDANVPSLLSLPYLDANMGSDNLYHATRRFVLSNANPYFFKGKVAEGIGGPHVGKDFIWPISIIMRGLTSTDDNEIRHCLSMLQHTHAGTGFMHESFHKDNAKNFTRSWFGWANTLFGEFVLKLYKEKPELLA